MKDIIGIIRTCAIISAVIIGGGILALNMSEDIQEQQLKTSALNRLADEYIRTHQVKYRPCNNPGICAN